MTVFAKLTDNYKQSYNFWKFWPLRLSTSGGRLQSQTRWMRFLPKLYIWLNPEQKRKYRLLNYEYIETWTKRIERFLGPLLIFWSVETLLGVTSWRERVFGWYLENGSFREEKSLETICSESNLLSNDTRFDVFWFYLRLLQLLQTFTL